MIKENAGQPNTYPTQSGKGVSQGLAGVRKAARENKEMEFTALLHHLTVDLLRESFYSLKRKAAPGVDGVTWQEYEPGLEDRLVDLHSRVHRGAYRATPSRRVYIEKADGRQRPLIRLIQKNGLSPLETLRTATVNAAEAMGRSTEFGSIEPGKRADLILLSANPLVDSSNLSRIEAVIVRGIVLNREDLDNIATGIRAIYDPQLTPSSRTTATKSDIEQMIQRVERLHRDCFIFRTHTLNRIEQLLQEDGETAEAARFAKLH